MSVSQCRKGHFYDDGKYAECPYCSSRSGFGFRPLDANVPVTRPFEEKEQNVDDEMKTVALDSNALGINPVCGWLVCLNGAKQGKDYPITGGRNTIGKGDSVDINLRDDNSVSRGCNATVAYDERNNSFSLICGEGKNIVYVNDSPLYSTVRLEDFDIIEVGRTKLMFHALCGENFKWENITD